TTRARAAPPAAARGFETIRRRGRWSWPARAGGPKNSRSMPTPSRRAIATCRSTEANVLSISGAAWKKSHQPPETTQARCPLAVSAAATSSTGTPASSTWCRLTSTSRSPSRAKTSSVGTSGSFLCDVVDVRTAAVTPASHRIELERLDVRRIDGFRHAPVLELRVASDVSEVRNLPPARDVAFVGRERLLRLLRVRLLGEQVLLERVFDRVARKRCRRARQHR